MSDQKPYLDGNTLWLPYNLEALNEVLDRLDTVPPPPPPGYTLRVGDDPAEALADLVAGDTLNIAAGVHPYGIHLPGSINLKGEPGAVLSGWREVDWEVYTNPFGEPVTYRTRWDRAAMGLNHRISNNAGFPAARQAVHNAVAAPELLMYGSEMMKRVSRSELALSSAYDTPKHAYDEKEGWLYIILPPDHDLRLVRIAALPQLLTAADGVNGVTVEGITFDGAANTTKQGAVQVYGEGWLFDRVTVGNVNSVGFMVGGIGHRFIDCHAYDCGQMGWAGKIDGGVFDGCGHTRSNWKGFDAGWEAGFKLSYSRGNVFTDWTATDCDGPGFWLDISNYDNVLDGFEIAGCMKAGLMLEHYAGGNVYRNGAILDMRAWPVTGARYGLQIQSHCIGNTFENIAITDSGTPVVYKAVESRGPSSKNIFRGVAGDAPWRIEGKLSGDDTFTNCTPQPV